MRAPGRSLPRTPRIAAATAAAVLTALGLAACGEPAARQATGLPGGLPRWHAVRGEKPVQGAGITIDVRSPVRLAIRYEGPETGLPQPASRLVPAGTSVTVLWGHRTIPPGAGTQVAPPQEAAEGRTENHGLETWFGWADGLVESRPAPSWARPGLGKVLLRQVSPPLVDEELPVGSRIELLAAAVADAASGEARLVPSPSGSRVRMPTPASPGDRSLLVRLWLEVLPP